MGFISDIAKKATVRAVKMPFKVAEWGAKETYKTWVDPNYVPQNPIQKRFDNWAGCSKPRNMSENSTRPNVENQEQSPPSSDMERRYKTRKGTW